MVVTAANAGHLAPEHGDTVRVWGNPAMRHLMQVWQEAFCERHPDVRFEYDLRSSALAMPALTTGVADLVLLGRRPRVIEISQFQFEKKRPPAVIEVAGGAFDVEGKSWPLIVYVHRDNPIRQLSIAQLDGIFGAQRSGGWNQQGTQWLASAARGKDTNLRHWGELGLDGQWQHAQITPYGFDIHSNSTAIAFSERVFNGGDVWNEALVEVAAVPGNQVSAGDEVTQLLGKDRFGIAIAGIQHGHANIRALAISRNDGNYIVPSKETVKRREYPLTRSIYLAFDDHSENPKREMLREFLLFVLGEEGQGMIAREGGYLPLPHVLVTEEVAKIMRPPQSP